MDNFIQRLRGSSARASAAADGRPDLVALLQGEHDQIRQLFEIYEDLLADGATPTLRQELAARICLALAMHAVVEEEIVYPAARHLPACRRAAAEAAVEHAAARTLIDEIALMDPEDPLFDAHVSVLSQYVGHHFDEEERELLPELARSSLDLAVLAHQAGRRRQALQIELDALDDED